MPIMSRNIRDGQVKAADIAAEAVSAAKLDAATVALLELLSDLPTVDVASPAIWNDAGVLKVGTDT